MVVALVSGCAAGRGWTSTNTALELGFAGELAIDAYQTQTYFLPTCAELNPIVGRCGERVPLAVYLPVSFALHVAIAWALPPRARDLFQAFSLGAEGLAITHNWQTIEHKRDRELRMRAAE